VRAAAEMRAGLPELGVQTRIGVNTEVFTAHGSERSGNAAASW
jgi:hypothetical protein